jgi:YcxB-like protein
MQETFKLNFNLSYVEYAGSLFRHFRRSRFLRIVTLFLIGLLLLSTLLGLATASEVNPLGNFLTSLSAILGTLLFLIILFFILTGAIYTGFRHAFKHVEIVFNHWGVNRQSDKINISKPWRDIVKAEETKTAFHIYISKNDFIIIPKRAFKDDNEMNSFGYFLSTRTDFKL